MNRFLCVLVFLCACVPSLARDLNLGQIREKFLDTDIVVSGPSFADSGSLANLLADWIWMEPDSAGGFKRQSNLNLNVPNSFRGARGKIVAIEPTKESVNVGGGQVDAFGRPIDYSRLVNPEVLVVVKLAGREDHIGTRGVITAMAPSRFFPAEDFASTRAAMEKVLEALQGKTIYNNGNTVLLDVTISLADLEQPGRRDGARDRSSPNLMPLQVLESRILDAQNAVILKVRMADGQERVVFGDLTYYELRKGPEFTPLERMGLHVHTSIPKRFSAQEMKAIRDKTIFTGMSEAGLFWSWGYPDKINDYGRGGKQYVYGTSQYVYVSNKLVRNFQAIR